MGLQVSIENIDNPRKEKEEHYYKPAHSGLMGLGLKPHLMTDDVLGAMFEQSARYRDHVAVQRILPRVRWHR